jgi:hypothetical protein
MLALCFRGGTFAQLDVPGTSKRVHHRFPSLPALLLAISCVASSAAAQEPGSPGRPENGYWSVGEPRWFVSAKPELGTPYAKPYVSFGYGIPHWLWTGIDFNGIVTMDMAQAYGGVRASSPILDLAFGVRDTWSFQRRFLMPARSYGADDLERGPGARSRYWAWEAEAVAIVPLPLSALVFNFIAIRTLDVPKNMFVYEESYRAVIADPLYFTMRVAAVTRLLREGSLRAGVLGEWVFGTNRERSVLRVGPALSVQLTDHLEANAVLSLAVASPDHLGLATSAYGVAGLRYRWASGERRPELPWKGEFIPW